MECGGGGGQQHPQPPTLSSQAGCAELYFLRYGHTDRWAHPDRQTTDKCNSHAHAPGRAPLLTQHPATGEGPPTPCPPSREGERWALPRDVGRGWGQEGAPLPALWLRAEGEPSPPLPHSLTRWGTTHTKSCRDQQPPARGTLARQGAGLGSASTTTPAPSSSGASPDLPHHQSMRGRGQHAVPPPSAAPRSITTPSRGGRAGAPGDQVSPARSAGRGKTLR